MNSSNKAAKNDFIYKSNNIFKYGYEIMKDKDNYLTIKRDRDDSNKIHSLYFNNIFIKKIKVLLFKYCLRFINGMIYNINDEGKICLLNVDFNLLCNKKISDLLELSLSDLFSFEVSKRYIKGKDYNKKIINEILQQKIEIEDFDTIIFLFKITFNDWIDLFAYKKDLFTLVNEYNAVNINYTKIKNNLIGVDHYLKEILKEQKNDKYASLFLLYIFNLKRRSYLKKRRNLKKKE